MKVYNHEVITLFDVVKNFYTTDEPTHYKVDGVLKNISYIWYLQKPIQYKILGKKIEISFVFFPKKFYSIVLKLRFWGEN